MASARVTVNPREDLGEVITWFIFNISGSFGNLVLFIVGFFIPRIRRSPLLLNLHFVVFVSSLMWSFLILSGEALEEHPRFGPCLASAAGALSFADAAVDSGLALVMKVREF